MSWIPRIAALQEGKTIDFRPHGNSMTPRIKSGQLCTVEPATVETVEEGDVVLCKVNGSVYLHLVTAKKDGQVQISNARGHVNGWTTKVFGKLVKTAP
jgi:phage repressor protein C with HTH and peptisase S24 domain